LSEKELQADIARLQAELTTMREAGNGQDRSAERMAVEIDERRADLRRLRHTGPQGE
jgi:hypothetical protein